MKKSTVMILVLVSGLTVLPFFNNCSSNSFTPSGEPTDSSNSTLSEETGEAVIKPLDINRGDPIDDPSLVIELSQDEIDDLLTQVPADQLEDPIPIAELENDESLFETYKCGPNGFVVYCHQLTQTKCTGGNSPYSHLDHIWATDGEMGEILIPDYLGPCR